MEALIRDERSEEELCVCCPECVKLFCKSANTDAEFVCTRCKAKVVAIVANGRVITFPEQRDEEDLPLAAEM